MIIFELGKIRLRYPELTDAENLSLHGNNRKIWLNCTDNYPHPYTTEKAIDWITKRTAVSPIKDMVIEYDGVAIGWIGIAMGDNIWAMKGEIGYWIGEDFWGKGILSTVLPPFVDYCFQHILELHKIHLYAYTRNPVSIRLFEKAGFTYEATFVQNCIKDGVIEDEVAYYLLRPDWEKK